MIETSETQKERRVDLATRAALAVLFLTPALIGLFALLMWVANGRIDWEWLLVVSLFTFFGLILGHVLEIRKQW